MEGERRVAVARLMLCIAVIIMGFVADYGFEYSDEEVEEEDVDIENQYYNSKGTDLGRLQLFFVSLFDPF